MSDFINDGQVYVPPATLAAQGYAQTPASQKGGIGGKAQIGQEIADLPMSYLAGAAERGTQPDASTFDRALSQGMSDEAMGYGESGLAATMGAPPPEPQSSPPILLSADEINKKYAPEGTTITDKPMSEGLGEIIGRQKAEAMQRESVLQRSGMLNSWPVQFATGMAVGLIDPFNDVAMMIPGIGEGRTLAALGKIGVEGWAARQAARAVTGLTFGAAQGVPLSLMRMGLAPEEAQDYGFRDALRDVFYNSVFGAVAHAGIAGTGRELGIFRPDEMMLEAEKKRAAGEPVPPPPPPAGSPETRAGVPDEAFSQERDMALRERFTAEGYHGEPVDLADAGFKAEEIAALHRDGLAAADGTMTEAQWAAWLDERDVRAPEPPQAPPPEIKKEEEELPTSPAVHSDAMQATISQVLDGRPADGASTVIDAAPQPRQVSPEQRPYMTVPKEPERLVSFLKRIGGLKDMGGDARQLIGSPKERPGIVSKFGRQLDDAALVAWEQGFFPEHGENRPSINDLLDAIDEDMRGNPQYSMHESEAVKKYQTAKTHNTEVDRLADRYGVDPEGKTRTEFYDAIAESHSFEELASEMHSQQEAHEALVAEFERQAREWEEETQGSKFEFDEYGEHPEPTWDAEEFYGVSQTRTLEDLESEHEQEANAAISGEHEGGGGKPEPAATPEGHGETGGGPRGGGVGATGRAGEEGAGGGAPTAVEPGTAAAGTGAEPIGGEPTATGVGNAAAEPSEPVTTPEAATQLAGVTETPPIAAETAAEERPKDSHGDPIFKKGERVVLENGRHGTVTNVTTFTWRSAYGGKASETSYVYDVKTDAGFITSGGKIAPEVGEAPTVVPDPIYQGHAMPPEQLQRDIEYNHKGERQALEREARARTPTSKKAQRDEAALQRKQAADRQAVLDKWKEDHPEEAARLFPEPETPKAEPAPTVKGMSLIETVHTRDKYPLFVVTMSDRVPREEYDALVKSAAEGGGRYSSYRGHGAVPGFTFKSREAAVDFMRKNGAEPPAETGGKGDAIKASTDVQTQQERDIADALAPAEGKGPAPITTAPKPPTDLLGRPIKEPTAPTGPEPTIKNDIRQIGIPGTEPSAVQAQAAADQKGRGGLMPTEEQKPADEGLFAKPEPVQPELLSQTPKPEGRPADWGANNKLVTRADAEAIRARLRAKSSQLNVGIDPEMMQDGARLAVFHIEAGARAFADYSREMLVDLGEKFRPYLRSWYEAARHWPGVEQEGMSSGAEIDALTTAAAKPVEETDLTAYHGTPEEREDGDRLLDAYKGNNALDRIKMRVAEGETPEQIINDHTIPFTLWEVRALIDAMDRRGELPKPGEEENGVPGTVSPSDEGAGSEGVYGVTPVGETTGAPEGKNAGGVSDVGGVVGQQAEEQPGAGQHGGPAGGGGTGAPPTDRVPNAGERPKPGATGRPSARPDAEVKGTDFRIEQGDVAEARGPKTKARDNLAAIELAKQLIADGRPATREEQAILVRYVGWGGLKGAFRDSHGAFREGFEDIGRRLEELLTPEEYRTAERSTQYAHYTAEHVIRSMWDAVRRLGFKGGMVFEPGMGIGHFLGMMPGDLAENSRYQGIEMDHLTASIAKLLYPESGIRQADFTRMALPENTFDLVIGNPPFSDTVIRSDPKYAARGFALHDYFFAKSLDSVRPGGLLGFVTSAGSMNKLDSAAREYLAERAEFVGGIRLPSSAFRRNAMTDVTTDILFFKRRMEGRVEGEKPTWTETVVRTLPNAEGIPTEGNVSRYFSEHPENVLGEEGYFDKLYQGRYAVHQIEGANLEADLANAVQRLPENVMEEPPTLEDRAALDFASGQKKDGSFYVGDDGRLMQYSGGAGREVPRRGKGSGGFTSGEIERIQALVPMRDALRDVFSADLARDDERGAEARERLNRHYDAFVAQFGPINKAEFQYRRPTLVQQESARLEAREEARSASERFDDGDFDPSEMIAAGKTVTEIAKARQRARDAAVAAGRTFDEGTFDPEEMPDVVFERRPNIKPFMSDPESYRLRSVEEYNEATEEGAKKEIFYRSILKHEEEPEIRSANDGVLWSLNKLGRFDVDAIAEKLGKERGEVISELGDSVFKVPGTRDTYQTKDEYLSGDVVSKLETARAEAENDPDVRRNIAALEAALPPPLPPSAISMNLGMPWIPVKVVADFVKNHLDLGTPRIMHNDIAGQWIVTFDSESEGGYPKWSVTKRNAYALLSDAMNRTPPRIYMEDRDASGKKVSVFDEVSTQEAQDKVNEMKDEFQNWLNMDTGRLDDLAQLYNGKLNRTVLRQYDGSYLTTPGVAATWRWRPHQTRVVARIVQDGNTYMAHAVGAGKTSAMIGAGMEMKRLGLVRKPLYVVPNHMLGQFTKEFYEQYPTARIAVADEDRFHTDRRRQFVANVAQDDLDAVIMTHSSFGKIQISDEYQDSLVQSQIAELREAMAQMDPKQDRFAVGRLQNQIEKWEQKLSRKGGKQDQTLTFEELGTDFLFVDEAHQFRKLSFATKQGNLKGISPEGSNMAWDLYTKMRYLDEQRPGRSAVLASGTPITNTMGELYSLSKFLQPQALAALGLSHFDSWAQTFGDTKTELEETPAGTYQPVTRFSKFVNLPELYKMVGGVMDIVTPKQLEQYVVRPQLKGGRREFHLAPRTPILDRYQEMLHNRMLAIKARKGPPQKGDDILLSVINDGRHSAIDPRMVEPTGSDPRSKLNIMVQNVARIWRETANTTFYDPADGYKTPIDRGPATQMIFANLGVNPRGPIEFSGYKWIKEALRREGIPANEIAFIGDYKGTVARQALFNDMNEGKVRILIGSTQKMGTGVNAQRRLYALHNQDPLWYPADDEQRVGRALRQGNRNPEIEIHDYSTKGTYDSAMWKMMGRKAGFIEDFFRGDPELRTMEDLGEASMYEQASAMSTTDERIITLTEMRQDLQRAQRREMAHDQSQYALRTKLKQRNWEADSYAGLAKIYKDALDRREDTRGKAFSMLVRGEKFDKRADAAAALDKALDEERLGMLAGDERTVGRIGGFPLVLENGKYGGWNYKIKLPGGKELDIPAITGDSVIQSAEKQLRGLEDRFADALASSQKAADAAKAIQPLIGQPFTGGAEIARLTKAVRDLEAELRGNPKDSGGGQANPPAPRVRDLFGHPAAPEGEGEKAAPPDPEMEEAERRLEALQEHLSLEDRAEIMAANHAVDEAELDAAGIEEAGACLRGSM